MSSSQNLTSDPIPKLIKQISVPVIIGFFFNTMFNVVDTYFGGKISTSALAAMSFSFPVYFLLIIFDNGIATGVTALLANQIGAKEHELARKYVAKSISFSILAAIILTVGGLLISPFLFKLLGATGETLRLALTFMNVIFYGAVFFMFVGTFNALLQSTGNTKVYRNFLIGGFILNVLLDPWLLYGSLGVPAMGLAGVALATVIVQILGSIYIFIHLKKADLVSAQTWKELAPDWHSFKEIAKQAVPASINMATIGIGIFIITYFISPFGDNAVAAYGIATRVEQIFLLPSIGLTIACLTLVGQNNGAKRFDRIKETVDLCLKYGVAIMAVGGILIFIFSHLIMTFFTSNAAVVEIGAHYLQIAAGMTIAYALMFINISALQGMKKPMYAVWIGLYRQIVAPLILFYILARVFGWGINGVWWGIFATVWSGAIVTVWYSRRVLSKLTA